MQQIDPCPLILTNLDLTRGAHALSGRPPCIRSSNVMSANTDIPENRPIEFELKRPNLAR